MHNAVLLILLSFYNVLVSNTLWLIILCIRSISYSFSYMDLKFLQYNEIVKALKTGDLRLLRQALREHEDRYVSVVSLFSQTTIGISLLMLFNPQILTIRCISCIGETGTPGLSKIDEENVKFLLISLIFQLEKKHHHFLFRQLCASKTKRPQQGTPIEDRDRSKSVELAWNGHGHRWGILQSPSSSVSYRLPFITLPLPFSFSNEMILVSTVGRMHNGYSDF